MQIGDKVWIFDSNNRVYQDDNGNQLNRCRYRGHFVEKYIVGETKQSLIIGYKGSSIENRGNLKVNKKTLTYKTMYGMDGKLYISEEEINRKCWLHDNQYRIQEKVGRCNDYDKLRKIEEILLSDNKEDN